MAQQDNEKKQPTIIEGVFVLKDRIGKGGMASVYLAEVDLNRFDYTNLYAYTQVQGEDHNQRRKNAEDLARELRTKTLDIATMRSILEAQKIPIPEKEVAVKIATGTADLGRFEAEWKNLLCLNHENVIRVYGGGVYNKRAYYAMELLRNMISPEKIIRELNIRQKLEVLIQAGRGLQYLHDNGLIHRDIKPDNMVTCEVIPGEYLTKVTDLGLGKNISEDLGMTTTGAILGSPSYMSPEQITCTRDVDHRTDVYSLGASLYEFACGTRPYHNKSTAYELISSVSQGELPIPVQELAPQLPDAIAKIIETCMKYNPDERYQSVNDFVEDLEIYLGVENTQLTSSLSFTDKDRPQSTAKVGSGRFRFENLSTVIDSEMTMTSSTYIDPEREDEKEPPETWQTFKTVEIIKRKKKKWAAGLGLAFAGLLFCGVYWIQDKEKTNVAEPNTIIGNSNTLQSSEPVSNPVAPASEPLTKTPPVIKKISSEEFQPNEKYLRENQVQTLLKEANPNYTGSAVLLKNSENRVTGMAFEKGNGIDDLSPLAGYTVETLDLRNVKLKRFDYEKIPLCKEMIVPAEYLDALFKDMPKRLKKAKVYNVFPFNAKEAKARQLQTAQELRLPVTLKISLEDNVTLNLSLIPAGEFMMGLDRAEVKEEQKKYSGENIFQAILMDSTPKHKIRITRPFYMATTETSGKVWLTVTGENIVVENPQIPIHGLSYNMINLKFFMRLRNLLKLTGTDINFSFPTEAQWEYAARAGSADLYWFGNGKDDMDKMLWSSSNCSGMPNPVASKPANPWGLCEINGNLWEWCRDWFNPGYYSASPEDDPESTRRGLHRILRGGSYLNHPGYSLSSFRGRGIPNRTDGKPGFRPVLSF